MGFFSHSIELSDVKRADHVYALRKFGTYQHHGIVITAADARRFDADLMIDGPFMVVEQNTVGLRIVTLHDFVYEENKLYQWNHTLRRVQYDENPFAYGIKRRGSCYTATCLPPDLVVENARLIYTDPDEKNKWSAYSLFKRNCEHFSFVCCTDVGRLSEQVLAKYDAVTNTLNTGLITAVPLIWAYTKGFLKSIIRIGEKLVPSAVNNLTINSIDELVKMSLPGNIITAVVAFAVEVVFLTVRWIIYICTKDNPEKRADHLAAGWAIDTKTYVKCLIQALVANGCSLGLSILGGIVGAFIPLPGAMVSFSVFFGFLGYVITRWSAGAIIDMLEKMIDEKKDKSIKSAS